MPQWIFWEDNISFVVFGAVDWPSSRVDYTDFEEARLREKKVFVCFHHYITGGPPQREEVLREIKMKRFLNFYYATMNEWEDNISFYVVFGAVDWEKPLG